MDHLEDAGPDGPKDVGEEVVGEQVEGRRDGQVDRLDEDADAQVGGEGLQPELQVLVPPRPGEQAKGAH
eukprot:5877736-Alexandrium_andersonii.AAC.1